MCPPKVATGLTSLFWKVKSTYLMIVERRDFLVPFSAPHQLLTSKEIAGKDSRQRQRSEAAQGCLPDSKVAGQKSARVKNYRRTLRCRELDGARDLYCVFDGKALLRRCFVLHPSTVRAIDPRHIKLKVSRTWFREEMKAMPNEYYSCCPTGRRTSLDGERRVMLRGTENRIRRESSRRTVQVMSVTSHH